MKNNLLLSHIAVLFVATFSFGTGIFSVSKVGQWDWQDLSGTASGATVTVSIPDENAFEGDASFLRLVGWDGTQRVDLSRYSDASDTTEDSRLSGTMIAGITAIGIGTAPTWCTTINGTITDVTTGSTPIEGMEVVIYDDTNGNGVVDPGDNFVATPTTNASGFYQ